MSSASTSCRRWARRRGWHRRWPGRVRATSPSRRCRPRSGRTTTRGRMPRSAAAPGCPGRRPTAATAAPAAHRRAPGWVGAPRSRRPLRSAIGVRPARCRRVPRSGKARASTRFVRIFRSYRPHPARTRSVRRSPGAGRDRHGRRPSPPRYPPTATPGRLRRRHETLRPCRRPPPRSRATNRFPRRPAPPRPRHRCPPDSRHQPLDGRDVRAEQPDVAVADAELPSHRARVGVSRRYHLRMSDGPVAFGMRAALPPQRSAQRPTPRPAVSETTGAGGRRGV